MSLVLPLAPSISRFTGSESSTTITAICSATTTLPCPTFIRRTAPFLLLTILDLLAHLLQHALAGQRGLAQLQVVGLAGDRVHLPPQLLQQEIEASTDRTVLVEHQGQLGQVRPQARQLLGNVRLVGPHRRLGQDARLVSRAGAEPPTQALAQPPLPASPAGRRPCRHRLHDRRELAVQVAQLVREPLALRD